MSLIRITAIAVAATILAAAPGSAGPVGLSNPRLSSPDRQIIQIQGGAAIPAAIIGGILGGAMDNGCYLNDCGYGYGYGAAMVVAAMAAAVAVDAVMVAAVTVAAVTAIVDGKSRNPSRWPASGM